MFALVIGLLFTFNQTARAESWLWENRLSFFSSENAVEACVVTGVLGTAPTGGTTSIMGKRLNRGGVKSTCASAVFPGATINRDYFLYNTHRVNNTTTSPICVTVTLRTDVEINRPNLQVAAFRAPFDGDVTIGYLGDPGESTGSPPQVITFDFTIPANTSVDLVVYSTNTNPLGRGTQYTLIYSSTPPLCTFTPPDLRVTKTHTGNFMQGDTLKTYSINVANIGNSATSGNVSVVDTLPTGLTATAIAGTGWTCTLETLTCTRGDALSAGALYPAITLTVSVAVNAPSSVTNVVSVSNKAEN